MRLVRNEHVTSCKMMLQLWVSPSEWSVSRCCRRWWGLTDSLKWSWCLNSRKRSYAGSRSSCHSSLMGEMDQWGQTRRWRWIATRNTYRMQETFPVSGGPWLALLFKITWHWWRLGSTCVSAVMVYYFIRIVVRSLDWLLEKKRGASETQ